MTQKNIKAPHVATLLLGIVALLLAAGSIAGMEQYLFVPRLSTETILAGKQNLTKEATRCADRLAKRAAAGQTDGSFILAYVEEIPQEINSQGKPSELDYIQCNGTMQMADGSWRAILNSGSASEGDTIRGCLIKRIEKNKLLIDVAGKEISLPKNESYYYKTTDCRNLVLDRIADFNGFWSAIFNDQPYRAGAWIDARTRILAVTPTTVLVQRDQKQMTFSETNPTGEKQTKKN